MPAIRSQPLLKTAVIGALLSLFACAGAAQQDVLSLPGQLEIPSAAVAFTEEFAKADNLNVAVMATDSSGLSPGGKGFSGASSTGDCRAYIHNKTPVTSVELYDQGFDHLDRIVMEMGGIDVIMAQPEAIPAVLIWADKKVPWRCVAGVIFNVQAAGYPTVGFVVRPVGEDSLPMGNGQTRPIFLDLPIPHFEEEIAATPTNVILVTSDGKALWNGGAIERSGLTAKLQEAQALEEPLALALSVAPETSYEHVVGTLALIKELHVGNVEFAGIEQHGKIGKDESGEGLAGSDAR